MQLYRFGEEFHILGLAWAGNLCAISPTQSFCNECLLLRPLPNYV